MSGKKKFICSQLLASVAELLAHLILLHLSGEFLQKMVGVEMGPFLIHLSHTMSFSKLSTAKAEKTSISRSNGHGMS
jgi:hypothetical protein